MFCKSTIQCFMCPCFFVYDENVIKIGIKNFLKICFENNERLGPNNYSPKTATFDISTNLKRICFWFECQVSISVSSEISMCKMTK